MKKVLIMLTIIMMLVPAAAFAGLFDFSVGATAQYKLPYNVNTSSWEWEDGMTKVENYTFGADIRTRLLFAEVDVVALYDQITPDTHTLSSLVTGGISLDLLGLVRIGLGLGPRLRVEFGDEVAFYDANGDELEDAENFTDALMKSDLTWRATVDLKLGKVLVGLNYTVDSKGFKIEDNNFADLLPGESQWNSGRIGVSALFTIF